MAGTDRDGGIDGVAGTGTAAGTAAISVIVPVHDRAALVGRALASALAQTLPPREIIVVDDGSTDATPAMLASFAHRHTQVRVIRQTNRGAAAARNRGVAAASGEWIAFLDSDDMWEPRKLEHAMAIAGRDPDVEFVHSNVRYRYPDGRERTWTSWRPEQMTDRGFLLASFLIKVPAVVVRRDLLQRLDGLFPEDMRTCEDFAVWWRAIVEAKRIGYSPEPDVVIHVSPGSLTQATPRSALLRDNIAARAHVRRWFLRRPGALRYEPILSRDQYWDYRELARERMREHDWRALARDARDCARDLSPKAAARMLASASLAALRGHAER